jgi:hypothetical protein
MLCAFGHHVPKGMPLVSAYRIPVPVVVTDVSLLPLATFVVLHSE